MIAGKVFFSADRDSMLESEKTSLYAKFDSLVFRNRCCLKLVFTGF